MNEHVAVDPRILDHYFAIYREESNATDQEKDQARLDLNHYLSRVTRNIERELGQENAITQQSNDNTNTLHDILGGPTSKQADNLYHDLYREFSSQGSSSSHSHSNPNHSPSTGSIFIRKSISRHGSKGSKIPK
jgi:hypothetical protein